MATWLSMARPFPVTYKKNQRPMHRPILGAVLHTTNSPALNTLEEFQSSWQAGQAQSAHFMIDPQGVIGQFRALEEVAWHIGGLSDRYIGIEHIAKWKEAITSAQVEASANLIAELSSSLGFPLVALLKKGEQGIGFHKQFSSTGCGEKVFTPVGYQANPKALDTLQLIIDMAVCGF